jgi:hypothetical protein
MALVLFEPFIIRGLRSVGMSIPFDREKDDRAAIAGGVGYS